MTHTQPPSHHRVGEIYPNELKSWEYAKEDLSIFASRSSAEAAKVKNLSDAGGQKLRVCPTQAETRFSVHLGITSLYEKIKKVSYTVQEWFATQLEQESFFSSLYPQ